MSETSIAGDLAARRAALDTSRSFIVQAPAGSGKTELLIQRFLALLEQVAQPEEIVAITFTRKAAGEMRARVLSAIAASAAGKQPETEHERATQSLAEAALRADRDRQWGLMENPGRLRIVTIDALARSLSAQMPLLSRLGAMPTPVEDAEDLYRAAARETLAQLEEPAAFEQVAALLRHLDNDTARAEDLLAGLLSRRDQWMRHHRRFDRAALSQALANLVRDRLQVARDAIPATLADELMACARMAATALSAEGAASPILAAGALGALPDAHPDQLAAWRGIAKLVLTQGKKMRKSVDRRIGFPSASDEGIPPALRVYRAQAKRRMEALLEQLADNQTLASALGVAEDLPVPEYSDEQWRLLEAIVPLLKLAVAQLELVFRERGVVDFIQLIIAAVEALGEPDAPTDLALAVDYRIRHLLVDEFQDTSLSQHELLLRLTAGWETGDGRTLLLVGDPMQSIYRFREAEVALFLRTRQHGLGGVALVPLTLTQNFRSQAGIVDWVNAVFARTLPEREDLSSGAVSYSPSIAHHPGLPDVAVRAHAAGQARDEARIVLELVQSAVAEGPGQTIAILVRNRSHLNLIVPLFKERGLRFRAIEIESLSHRPAVQDLHALTRALLHLADRAAWLSILRAPWCGLTLTDLERLCEPTPGQSRGAHGQGHTLWHAISDAGGGLGLSPDGQARLARTVAALSPAMEQRARGSLRQRIEAAWLRLGGPASVQMRADLEDVRVYLDLIEELEAGGDLEDLAALDDAVGRLFASPDVQAPETLQIMTVHKAKGLEFDVVIVPGLGGGTRRDEPTLLRWVERPRDHDESDLLLAAINPIGSEDDPIYDCLSGLQRERQRHEDGRLLYVAATRARQRLHLVAQVQPPQNAKAATVLAAPARGSLLDHLWPMLAGDFERSWSAKTAIGELAPTPPTDPMRYPLRRLSTAWSAAALPASVTWRLPIHEEEVRDTQVEFSWAGETARHVGTVVHAFLQRIADEGLARWDAQRIENLKEVLRLALRQQGVPAQELESAHARVAQALRGALTDPRARWILSEEHTDARNEYRLTGEIDQVFANIILDRTFVDRNGVRWIIDYKTGVHEGAGIERFLDNERERYRDQLERYAAMLSRQEQRPIRLGLYYPLIGGWREWEPAAGTRQLKLDLL